MACAESLADSADSTIMHQPLITLTTDFGITGSYVGQMKGVILSLAEQGKVVIYEQPLPLRQEPSGNEGTLLEQVIDEIARLQATGAIDIETELNIVFIGDERVLGDLELLANSGYGEDNFGNNIALPEQLAYLRR